MTRSAVVALLTLAMLPLGTNAQDVEVERAISVELAREASQLDLGEPASLQAPLDAPALTAENVAAFFDAAFNLQRLEHEMVGGVVTVVYDGKVLFKRGYGWADLEERVPVDPDETLFRIASVTKTFVWTAIMQLVEQGRLSLEDDVNRHLDFEIPDTFEEPIRIWHLLSHTPGFEERGRGGLARSPDDLRGLGEDLPTIMPARVRPPGEHASYSNFGAALAGYIVERVSGQPWSDYIEEHILRPLEMTWTNTQTVMAPELQARHAKGYRFERGGFVSTDFMYSRQAPAGHMSSSGGDMARFMLAHLSDGALGESRILEQRTARLMHSPLFAPHPELAPILHGFYRSDRNGQVVFGHGGDVNQFHSNMSLLPEVGLGVFISFNSDPASAARSNLILAFLDHFFPGDYLRAPPEPFDLDLSDYAGEYIALRNNFSSFERTRILSTSQSITVRDGHLLFGGNRLVPVAPDRFTGMFADRAFVFERDEDGKVTHLIAGSPLSTLQRARGLESPSVVQGLLMGSFVIGLLAVLGWGYRGFRRAPEEKQLPKYQVLIAWIHSLAFWCLVVFLMEGAGSLAFGVPPLTHAVLWALNAILGLGLLVVAFSVRQWTQRQGSVWTRGRYAVVALASLVNLWFAWSFNLVSYVFTG